MRTHEAGGLTTGRPRRTAPEVSRQGTGADGVLRLQRLAGNAAVCSLLTGQGGPTVHRCGPVPCDCPPEARGAAAAPVQRRPDDRGRADCPTYEAGEIKQSRTPEGHLDADVDQRLIGTTTYLQVVDFGVGRSKIKNSAKDEPLLQKWLGLLTAGDMYQLKIEGSTDCVGHSATNERLKRARAESFQSLVGARTESVIVSSGPGVFVYDNSSAKGRAANRGVAVQIAASVEGEGDEVTGKRRTWRQVVEHARAVYRRKSSRADDDWTFYGSLTMLLRPGTDDRYIDGWQWQNYGAYVAWGTMKHLRDEVLAVIDVEADDDDNYRELRRLASQIDQGIAYGLTANVLSSGGGSAIEACHRRIIQWMKGRTGSRTSIYSTWKDAYVGPPGRSLGWSTPC